MPKLFEKLNINHPVPDPEPHGTFDPEPGVREPEAGTDFLPPDPDLPAVQTHDRDILTVLENIENNTSGLRQHEGIIWQPLNRRLPATAGDVSVLGTERVKNIYIPNAPRTMTIYTGSSRGLYIGKLEEGQSLNVELPYYTNGVFIEYEDGTDGDQINVYLSSKPISISILPGIAVYG